MRNSPYLVNLWLLELVEILGFPEFLLFEDSLSSYFIIRKNKLTNKIYY
jgi:hypothetical protein